MNTLIEKPFSIPRKEKKLLLFSELERLWGHHVENCSFIKTITNNLHLPNPNAISDFLFLPVQLFKKLNFKSIPENQVYKVLTSSGTTGEKPSRVYLDVDSAKLQQEALSSVVTNFLGKKRLPMLIIDSPKIISHADASARAAAILGFSCFGRDHTYALNEKMELNTREINLFLEKYKNKEIFIFGFTFIIWQYFYQALINQKLTFDLANATLIHGGGWKKLVNLKINRSKFKTALREKIYLTKIHDYYGMIEQIGTIFLECDAGYLHVPSFADVVIRDPLNFSIQPFKKEGIIQVLSTLPRSYPGNSLLTEDIGEIIGEDDCICGRLGKYILVHGRVKSAEVRGCSDARG